MTKRKHKPPSLDLSPYRGEWVAIDPKTQTIVSHDVSFRNAERAALSAGVARPLLMPVPKSTAHFVGNA